MPRCAPTIGQHRLCKGEHEGEHQGVMAELGDHGLLPPLDPEAAGGAPLV